VVDLKKPEESLLLKAVHHRDGLEMPPTGKLPEEKIKVLEAWVKAGAPWPAAVKVEGKSEPAKHAAGGVVTPEAKNYWAYKSVQRPALPAVKQKEWVKNPVDAFLLAKLEAKGLSPNPPADRLALVRVERRQDFHQLLVLRLLLLLQLGDLLRHRLVADFQFHVVPRLNDEKRNQTEQEQNASQDTNPQGSHLNLLLVVLNRSLLNYLPQPDFHFDDPAFVHTIPGLLQRSNARVNQITANSLA
jgi:hypothetical protein